MNWGVMIDFYGYFITAAILGIIMYYWTKATMEVRNRKLANLLDQLGVDDLDV